VWWYAESVFSTALLSAGNLYCVVVTAGAGYGPYDGYGYTDPNYGGGYAEYADPYASYPGTGYASYGTTAQW